MISKNIKWFSVVFFSIHFFISCSNGTEPEELTAINISKIKNIQWNLVSLETTTNNIILNNYEPFRIALLENNIWGTDNCNFLGGNYLINDDSLVITYGGVTELGCPSFNLFPFKHLFRKPSMKMRGNKLVLINNDSTYVYYSKFTGDITTMNLLNDTLSLINSNDANISFFDSLGFYPKLILTSERKFNIQWYNKSPENTGFINKYSGIFGVNDNKEILFTKISSAYEGNGVSIIDWQLVDRIIEATKFEINTTDLTMINALTNTYYKFSK